MSHRVRVLHVVESYGAGTASALDQYVRATPDLEHHVIRHFRPDDDHADDGELERFTSVADLPTGAAAAVRSVRRRVAELQPDVVHGHSSFGGAYARLAVGRGGPVRVYTPHCFASERRDISAPARLAFELTERLLAGRTDVVAGCSEREVDLARRFAPRARHQWIVNVTDLPLIAPPRPAPDHASVVAVGRITAQRDPELFASVVAQARTQCDGIVEATWIGGGDTAAIERLAAADVEVTGWLPRSEALRRLAAASAYVHTAAWDGAPMTLIEAQTLGVPVIARRSAAVTGPADWVGSTADDLGSLLARVLGDPATAQQSREAWGAAYAHHTVARQRADLLAAYGLSVVEEAQ